MNVNILNEEGNEAVIHPELYNPILGHNELFEYDRDQIERGSYMETRKSLSSKMCGASVNIACEVFLMLWLMFLFPRVSYSSLYLMEKVWLMCWILT